MPTTSHAFKQIIVSIDRHIRLVSVCFIQETLFTTLPAANVSIFLESTYIIVYINADFIYNNYTWKQRVFQGGVLPVQKIAVVGSSYFEKYVEQIKTADMFPQVELFFIPDNGAPANIDINFVLNLIEEKAIQAIVLGPFDYERLAPLISIPCYIVLPNLQDFLLLHNRVKDYKKTAVVLSPQYEIDLSSLEQCLHIKYNRFFYSQDGVKDLIRQLKADGYSGVSINNEIKRIITQTLIPIQSSFQRYGITTLCNPNPPSHEIFYDNGKGKLIEYNFNLQNRCETLQLCKNRLYKLIEQIHSPINLFNYMKGPIYGPIAFCNPSHKGVKSLLDELSFYHQNSSQSSIPKSKEWLLLAQLFNSLPKE